MKGCFVALAVGFAVLAVALAAGAAVAFVLWRRRTAEARRAGAPDAAAALGAPPPPPSRGRPEGAQPSPAAASAAPSHGRLTILAGPLAGRTFAVPASGFWIGRDETADVVVPLASVTRRHLWVGPRDGVVVAVDRSTNGTFLAATGERLGERRLHPGDVLVLAGDVARLRYDA